MADGSEKDLGDFISRRREISHGHARGGIEKLRRVALESENPKLADELAQVNANLAEDRFRLIVIGRFNNGKSTLLNALLGEPERPVAIADGDLLPSNRRPTTAVLTDIVHADAAYARVWRFDGTRETWPLDRFQHESQVKATQDENTEFFAAIRQFEVGYPAKLLRSVTLVDSPGFSDIPLRDAITREAVDQSDAALTVYRSETPAGMDERAFALDVQEGGCRLFTVVNLISPDSVSDGPFMRFMWDRLVGRRDGGSTPSVEEFARLDIFFVDALSAHEARKTGDRTRLEASGLPLLEERLADFLLKEKFVTHMQRFIARADRLADRIERDLRTREVAYRASVSELRAMIDRLAPKVKSLRDQRQALNLTIARYEQIFAGAAQQAFSDFITGAREAIVEELNKDEYALTTIKGWGIVTTAFSSERRKEVGNELSHHISDILARMVGEWSGPNGGPDGLLHALDPQFRQLMEEVEVQVRRMDETLSEARLEQSGSGGLELPPMRGIAKSIEDRLFSEFGQRGTVGAMVGGGLAAILVATIGAKIAIVVTGAILAALGIALNPLLILGLLVAAVVGGAGIASHLGIEGKLKADAAETVVKELPLNREATEVLKNAVASNYRAAVAPLVESVAAAIDDEETQLQTLIGAKEGDSEKQATELSALAARFEQVAEAREALAAARASLGPLSSGGLPAAGDASEP